MLIQNQRATRRSSLLRLVQTQRVDEESINHVFFRSEDREILHPQQHLLQGYELTNNIQTASLDYRDRLKGGPKVW